MRRMKLVFLLAAAACVAASPACAEIAVEAWRSPFGSVRDVSVNAADSSCWASSGANLIQVASDGTVLATIGRLGEAGEVAVNPTDGSVWVWDERCQTLSHFTASGARRLSKALPLHVGELEVDGRDGSVWIADLGSLIHLASDGEELWSSEFGNVGGIAVDPRNGSCWAVYRPSGSSLGSVVHLASDGSELWRNDEIPYPRDVAVNSGNGTCWVGAWEESIHFAEDGTELVRVPESVDHVAVDPNDGSCWMTRSDGAGVSPCSQDGIWHWSVEGTLLWEARTFADPGSISVDPSDGSVWLEDRGQLVHLAADGTVLWRSPVNAISHVTVNPADGSVWVADPYVSPMVVRISREGTELGRYEDVHEVWALSVDEDGSCLVADYGEFDGGTGRVNSAVVHLSEDLSLLRRYYVDPTVTVLADPRDDSFWTSDGSVILHLELDGTELLRVEPDQRVRGLAVDPVDGSCWFFGKTFGWIDPQGDLAWEDEGYYDLGGVSADPRGGSCWVVDAGDYICDFWGCRWEGELAARVNANGTQAAVVPDVSRPWACAVNTVDATCWISGENGLWHVTADGTVLWHSDDYVFARHLAPDPARGSCWVSDSRNGQLVRLDILPDFPDVSSDYWAADQIDACVEAGVVTGFGDGTYQPAVPVTRDQMAVYIARALAGGEAHVPEGPVQATFHDVPTTHWAFGHVEYCVANGVVGGYDPVTYAPAGIVTRDAMAVFVSRAIAGGDDGVPEGPAEATFDDVPTNHWAYRYVEYCVANGVATGYDPVTYAPAVSVTRDQMAVYVARAFGLGS